MLAEPNHHDGRYVLPIRWLILIATAATLICGWKNAQGEETPEAAANERLARTVLYLSSDELEGRGLGSKGLDLAADYIAGQFREIGLKTDLYDGAPFQKFTAPAASPHGTKLPIAPGNNDVNGKPSNADRSKADANNMPPPATEPNRIAAKNVVAVLEGEGPHADEAIVIGAHYDHLGRGEPGSLEPDSHEIHHGADDNASGVAAMLEIARQLAAREKKLPRQVVFIAFTGEERGLYGSAHYVKDPLAPLDKTIAMLNLDMVGRMTDDKLIVYGTGTASEWGDLLTRLNEKHDFQLTRHPEGYGPSDHSSFYAKRIPVLFFFTGTHKDYHRPSDTFDKINVDGMRRVAELVADAAVAIAETDARPTYKDIGGPSQFAKSGDRPYFGSIPDFSQDQPGYALMGVSKGGPAEAAGIQGGDIILRLGDYPIANLEDFDTALRKFKAGDRITVLVKRGSDEMKFAVTLEPPRQ
ncbi:MAG TPA: M20/M25/M40 family metallo-hydrolase [Pirellulales bacterium]|nr:M20/M25/M40 family metallo-hydrolase [Pirellulales bacterium]